MEATQYAQFPVSILVAEDEQMVRFLFGAMIPRKFPAATLYFAENGSIGVELFKEKMPEIVITDINMPVMDGISMAGKIKALKADTRIIVVTAYDDSSHIDQFAAIGASDYIVKPIDFGKLFAAIGNCIAELAAEEGRKRR